MRTRAHGSRRFLGEELNELIVKKMGMRIFRWAYEGYYNIGTTKKPIQQRAINPEMLTGPINSNRLCFNTILEIIQPCINALRPLQTSTFASRPGK